MKINLIIPALMEVKSPDWSLSGVNNNNKNAGPSRFPAIA